MNKQNEKLLELAVKAYNHYREEGKPEIADLILGLTTQTIKLTQLVENPKPYLDEDGFCSNCNTEAEVYEDECYDDGRMVINHQFICPSCHEYLF